jgi:hypothetical protein
MIKPGPSDPHVDRPAIRSTQKFRRNLPSARPTPEQLRRQDSLLRCAWDCLGQSGSVIAFLNSHNEELGGQPLHLALHSDEGLLRVERLLGEMGRGT